MSSSSRSISKMSTLLWIMYVVLLALVFPVSSQLQPMIAEQRMRPKWKQYCTFNNALRCHPTIVAQSASGIVNQGWKIYRSPKTKDYYVGITCPQQCWQNIRVYSNMHTYNGVATLSFYYYIWETKQKEGDRLVPQLRIKGCNNEEVWRSGDNPQSHETGEWLGVVVPIYCSNSFSIIFEGIMSSGGQVIAVDNVALTDGRTFTNVLPQPAISVVHPTLPPNTPVIPSRGTRPAVRPRPPIIRPPRPTHRPPQQPPVTDRTTTVVWTTKPKVLSSTNGTADHVPSTAIEGGSSSGKGNFSAIPKLLVALALCICSLTLCIHCIIYRKQKKSHNMKQAGSSIGPAPVSGQLSSCSSVCEIVITDHSRNSWAINRIDNPDLPGPSHGLSADHLTTNHRPRLATCTLGSKAFNSNLTGVSELRPSGRASSLPSRPTPNIYESIDEVKNGLSSHPSNFFLNLSKRSSFVKKVVHTLELPFRKSHVEKGRGSASLTKERSLSDATAKAEASKNHKRAFRKSNSHSGGIRFFPSSLSSLNSQCDAQPSQKRNNLSPALPKRPLSIVFGKHSSRKPSFRTSLSKSRSHSDVNTAVSGRKLVPSGVSPYSCSKLPNISFQLNDSKPSVHFAKSSAETSPNQSISEEPNETTSSSRMSEHFYHDLDSQFRPTVSANLYHVLDPTSFESSSSSEDEDFDKKRSTVKRNTVLQRTESGYTVVSKSSYNSDFENSVGSSLSNIQALDRVYFRLESLDNSQHDTESEFGARDGLLDHEFDMSCDLQRRSQKYGRRLSDLETTCTLSMYEESGRLLDDTDISSTIDDRPDVLRGVRA